jgi:hypothetical protein
MTSKPVAGEAVRKIPNELRGKLYSTDPIQALDFAVDMLRVVAVALVNREPGAMSDEDIHSAGYLIMHSIDALKTLVPVLDAGAKP